VLTLLKQNSEKSNLQHEVEEMLCVLKAYSKVRCRTKRILVQVSMFVLGGDEAFRGFRGAGGFIWFCIAFGRRYPWSNANR
jgi:hypothetical protein